MTAAQNDDDPTEALSTPSSREPERREAAGWEFAELLARLHSGEPRAFQETTTRFGGRLRAYAAARSAEDPDGIVNETLLAVFRQLHRFEGDESQFTSMVFAIARHKVIDEARKRQRRPEAVSPMDGSNSQRTTDIADDYVSLATTLSILDQLPDDQRDVVIMRTIIGMSFLEIGRTIGKREATVRVIHHRALAVLRDLLA